MTLSEDCKTCSIIKTIVSRANKTGYANSDDVFTICAHIIELHRHYDGGRTYTQD